MPQSRLGRFRLPAGTVALLGLLAVTASWGSTFFMLKGTISRVPAADFLALRFALAAVVVWLCVPRAVSRLSRLELRRGVLLGVAYGAAQLLQTIGIEYTSASVSGFITGLYVVLTPLLAAVLLRARLGGRVWTAVALASGGLGLLSLQGMALGRGEMLTLAGAVMYALHVVGLSVWSRRDTVLGLTVVQLGTIAAVCAVGAAPGGLVLPSRGVDWAVLIYMALVAGAVALVVQTWAQAHVSATRAAITMTMEPVWAAAFAVAFGGERLGVRAVGGGALVLAAMYVVELGSRPAATVADVPGAPVAVEGPLDEDLEPVPLGRAA